MHGIIKVFSFSKDIFPGIYQMIGLIRFHSSIVPFQGETINNIQAEQSQRDGRDHDEDDTQNDRFY